MFNKNNIVIYKNQVAIIDSIDDKINILTSNSKIRVREKDITLLDDGPASLTELNSNSTDENKINSLDLQLKECYELLSSDESSFSNEFSFKEIADLTIPEYSSKLCWLLYSLLISKPYFSQTDKLITFTLRTLQEIDEINQKQYQKNNEQQLHDEFLQRLKTKKLNLPSDAKYMQEVEAFCLGKTDKSKLLVELFYPKLQDKTKAISDLNLAEMQIKAHQLLLDTNIWNITTNPYPARYGLTIQSAQENLPEPPNEERLSLNFTSYAIDNEDSTDPDDAVSFDGNSVWIHIADPASTVLPDSKIDLDARKRGATLYLPECTSRMMNEQCFNSYALGLTEKSKALSFKITLDDKANIIDTEILKTLVHVERLTYSQADTISDNPILTSLFEIAKKYNEKRVLANCVSIELPEVNISVTKDTDKIVTIKPSEKTKSSLMIKEMMLLAGEAVAKFAFKNNIPFPFISQDSPEFPKDLPTGLSLQYKLRKFMRGRNLGVIPSVHSGLGLGMYCQVTSPLRRYTDLLAHQQLRSFLNGSKFITKEELLEKINLSNAGITATIKAERASNLHWKLVYLLQNPDKQFKGIVVDKKNNLSTILIPEIAFESTIHSKENHTYNTEVLVKAENISIPKLAVNFIEC